MKTVIPDSHPPPEVLHAFAHGRLIGADFQAVETHIEHCDECCGRLAEQPENTLLALAREVATLGRTQSLGYDEPLAEGPLPEALQQHPRYAVEQLVGRGGMGAVYRAQHRLMHRTVALKVIHPRLVSNPKAVERFEREVRLAAKLTHPNIVVAYDADQADNLHFLVMEYVEGVTLDRWVSQRGPCDYKRACQWLRQAALGLQHAYEQGMAHRDIKPQNLIITSDEQVRILDFGLSRLVDEPMEIVSYGDTQPVSTAQTRADVVLGTPDYIAPEQIAHSHGADIRSDIYSLGCTLYFLLTGRPPFRREGIRETLQAQLDEPIPRLALVRRDAPESIQRLLDRMTAKQPNERFQTPQELIDAVDQLLTAYEPARLVDRLPGPSGLKPWMRMAFAASLMILALGAWIFRQDLAAALHRPSARLLVMLPSEGLWFPDYKSLVDAAPGLDIDLHFASIAERPSGTIHTSVPGVAVPDLKLDDQVRAKDYDGIVFIGYSTNEFSPGGIAGADTKRLINEFLLQKKVLAAVCSGQRVLAQHGVLRGRAVTPAPSVTLEEITVEGGTRREARVLVDGPVVTSASADYSPELLAAIKKLVNP